MWNTKCNELRLNKDSWVTVDLSIYPLVYGIHNTLHCICDNTHKRQTYNPSSGIETTIPASERPQTLALDNAAIGIGMIII
jgi:hypothetical protein